MNVGTTCSPSTWGSASSTWWPRSAQSFAVSCERGEVLGGDGRAVGGLRGEGDPQRAATGRRPLAGRGAAGGGATYGSPGPGPAVASSSAAVSRTLRVTACSVEHPPRPSPAYGVWVLRPRVGFRPTNPQHAAGARIEPKPSEACAIGSIRAPTAAAAPPDEPPEIRLVSQGLRVGPYCAGLAGERKAELAGVGAAEDDQAGRLQPPRPARCSAATGGVSAKKREPRVTRSPASQPPRSLSR